MLDRIAPVVLLCLVALLTLASTSAAQDPGIRDTVRIDSVVAYTNSSAVVPVNFYNDQTLGGLELTLRFSSPGIQVDSFSFVGGRLQFYSVKGTFAPTGGYSIYCLPLGGEPVIPAGTGLMGRLYLSWDVSILPQVVTIDTITVLVNDVEYSNNFSTPAAQPFKPRFRAGKVNILQGFGCCINIRGNADGDAEDRVNVADLTALVAQLFRGAAPADCPEEANVNGEGGPGPNIADITYLVNFLFKGGPPPAPCQ